MAGKPHTPEDKKLSKLVSLYFTPGDHEALDKLAEQKHLKLSTLLRVACLTMLDKVS